LSDSWVYSITEDKEGNLWIGTRNGLNKFNYNTNKFYRYQQKTKPGNTLYRDNVYGCVVSDDGIVYTNTPPLINAFNPKTEEYTHYQNNLGQNPNVEEQTLPIIIDSEGIIWAATTFGLTRFDPESKKFTNFQHNEKDSKTINSNNILTIYEDLNGNILAGTPAGINIFDRQSETFSHYKVQVNNANVWFQSIVQDQKGNYWVGTQGNGVLKLRIDGKEVVLLNNIEASETQSPNTLNHSIVNTLFIDFSHNLWIGTLNGLDKTNLKDPRFSLYRKSEEENSVDLLDNVIASIYKHSDGTIWVGNWGKGLNIVNRETGKVTHYSSQLSNERYIPNDFVHVIFEYTQSEIWIGTRSGIFVFDNQRFVPFSRFYKSSKLPDLSTFRISHILKDAKNNVWIATQGGLFYVNMNDFSFVHYTQDSPKEQNLSDNLIYSITFDHDSTLWIASKNGLNYYSPQSKKITHILRQEGLQNTLNDNYTVSICYTSDSSLLIGTKSGINKLNIETKKFTYITEADGLPAGVVYEIIEDDWGNVWFGTGNGLAELKKGETKLTIYSEDDGLQGAEFNLHAGHKSKDGEIFFGGMNGFNSYFPNKLSNNMFVPSVEFTSFQKQSSSGTENIHITENSSIILKHNDYAFNVEFAALEFTSPNKNQYAYKFTNSDGEWIYNGNRRFLTFSNISPGVYQLWVKGSNNDGIWNEEGTSITIKVLPPWWRSWVAYFVYIILILIGIIAFIKYREKKLVEQKRVLEHMVKERTMEVEMQKNEIIGKNEELESQNVEIMSQRDLLSEQNQKISKQNKQIKDSIQYASRIQNALLPSTNVLSQNNIDHFLILKPKDIVSGDFYWFKQVRHHLLFAVADCTGHGVPGAFMSMLGNAFLNEIVMRNEITRANQVLEKLRNLIISSLMQSGEDAVSRDGMDIAFCEIDLATLKLQYAGAHVNLIIVRNNEIITVKADRIPVGLYHKEQRPFTNQDIQLQSNDKLYLFTDGIIDQFGGEHGGKFMLKRFLRLITDINQLPMDQQQRLIEASMNRWMNDKYEQIDDITVLGLHVL